MLLIAGFVLAQQPEPISLAVSDLAAQGVKESEAVVISEQLRAELMKSPRIRLIERIQMKEILTEQKFQQSDCVSDACAVEVGQLLGVKNMVVGSIGMAGSYTVISVRVVDVGTGSIIVNESIKTKGGIDKVLESGVAVATEKLISGLFPEPAKPRQKDERSNFVKKGVPSIIGGIGVASGVVSLVFLNKWMNQQDEYRTVIDPARRAELVNSGKRSSQIAGGSGGFSIAAISAGAMLFWWWNRREEKSAALAPIIVPGGCGALVAIKIL